MSDETKAVSFEQEKGQAPEADVVEEPKTDVASQKEEQPSGITREEVQALLDRQYRQLQSLVDKAEDRTVKRVQDRFAQLEDRRKKLEATGTRISDERFQQLKEEEAMKIFSEFDDDKDAQPFVDDGPTEAEKERVRLHTERIYKDAGVTIEKEDPEAKELNFDDPYYFLDSLRVAVQKKKARLEGQQKPEMSPETAAARSPAVGGSGGRSDPLDGITDPKELYKRHFERGK